MEVARFLGFRKWAGEVEIVINLGHKTSPSPWFNHESFIPKIQEKQKGTCCCMTSYKTRYTMAKLI